MLTLKNTLGDPSILEGGKIDAPLLFLGLVYREVSRSMEVEPGEPSIYPPQLKGSPFGYPEVKRIEKLLDGIHLPSKK